MASQDQPQGVFGKFKPVLEPTLTFTGDEIQGVFGKFEPVFDPASTAVTGRIMSSLVAGGGLAGPGGIAGQHGGLAG